FRCQFLHNIPPNLYLLYSQSIFAKSFITSNFRKPARAVTVPRQRQIIQIPRSRAVSFGEIPVQASRNGRIATQPASSRNRFSPNRASPVSLRGRPRDRATAASFLRQRRRRKGRRTLIP